MNRLDPYHLRCAFSIRRRWRILQRLISQCECIRRLVWKARRWHFGHVLRPILPVPVQLVIDKGVFVYDLQNRNLWLELRISDYPLHCLGYVSAYLVRIHLLSLTITPSLKITILLNRIEVKLGSIILSEQVIQVTDLMSDWHLDHRKGG